VAKILGSTPHRSVGIRSMSHSTSIGWLNDTLFLIYLTLDAEGLVKYPDVQMSDSPFIARYMTLMIWEQGGAKAFGVYWISANNVDLIKSFVGC
jgi:hypothetical protein